MAGSADSRVQDANEALLLDLLAWIAAEERTYAQTMAAWRTSCPRLPVWEMAVDRGLVSRGHTGSPAIVRLTEAGRTAIADGGFVPKRALPQH